MATSRFRGSGSCRELGGLGSTAGAFVPQNLLKVLKSSRMRLLRRTAGPSELTYDVEVAQLHLVELIVKKI